MKRRNKRIISLLLGLTLLLPMAFACTTVPDESSGGGVSDGESSSEESEPYVDPENELRNTIDALYGESADKAKKAINVLEGLTPQFSRVYSNEYPGKNGMVLTDGERVTAFDSSSWLGFSGRQSVTISFDLGEVVDGLADFEVGCFKSDSYGIGLPSTISLEISEDGEEYVRVAAMLAPNGLSSTEAYAYKFCLSGTVSARYLKFEISATSSAWLFIDEITAIKYEGEPDDEDINEGVDTVDDYYGDTVIPEVTEPEYWDESESDYNDEINLIAGLEYQIEQFGAFYVDYATTHYNSKESAKMLTDGKFATKATYSDSAYFRFTSGIGRAVIFDLGKESAVSSFTGSFLFEESTGVKLPRIVSIKASRNGVDWQTIHTSDAFRTLEKSERVQVSEDFDKTYRARFIKIEFEVTTHIYCDELAIYGTKHIPSDAADITPDIDKDDIYPDRYITPDDFMGVNNMLLSYHCLPDDIEGGRITVEEYLPHVGYYNTDGELVDTFFDAFLYLPYTRFNYDANAQKLEGWKFYVDNQFAEDRNVDALDQAVSQVSEQLGLEDYKAKVFFSILYTFTDSTQFGDVDGDGVIESFQNLGDRKKAIKWLIDEQVKRFEEGNYENLELLGFYWFEEAIAFSDPHEEELISYARDYVHSLGYKIFWIPYYQASGYSEWKEMGFDLACMQPNYMFSGQATIDRLYDTAAATKRLGMCVELEIGQFDSRTDILKYKEYLAVGAETGYMDAVKIYYQGGVPGAFYYAYLSKDPLINSVYHDTYLFAKGKYEPSEATGEIVNPADMSLETTVGRGVSGNLNVETESEFRVRIASSPRYGTVRLNGDGTILYNPFSGFAGTDEFTVYLEYGFGVSETATVTVRVKEN